MRTESSRRPDAIHRGTSASRASTGSRILAFTGDGKGKTTAAMGMVLRALAAGMRAMVVQFVKSRPSGEIQILSSLGVRVEVVGCGFVPPRSDPAWPRHLEAARQGLLSAAVAVGSGSWDLVVLDEVGSAMTHGLLDPGEIADLARANTAILVLTGRGIPQAVLDRCDTVSRVENVKHGLSAGIQAQAGVER